MRRLRRALELLEELFASTAKVRLNVLVAAHSAAVEFLGKVEAGTENAPLFRGEGGEDASKFLATLRAERRPRRTCGRPIILRSIAA